MSRQIDVALLQIEPRRDQDRQDHLASVMRQVQDLRGTDLIVLPELWNVGYFSFDAYAAEAEPVPGSTTERLGELARSMNATLHAGSILERDSQNGDLYNTSVVFSPQGTVIATYRKMHVFGYQSRERELVSGGDVTATFDIGGAQAGLSICYDLRFPEIFRMQADDVALYVVPATWPAARVSHWRALLRARAIENQAFVIGCNAAGVNGGVELGGHSAVIDPLGEVLAEAVAEPATLRTTIDLEVVRATRANFPALRDRVLLGGDPATRVSGVTA